MFTYTIMEDNYLGLFLLRTALIITITSYCKHHSFVRVAYFVMLPEGESTYVDKL